MSDNIGDAANDLRNVISRREGDPARNRRVATQGQIQRLKGALLQARSVIMEELSPAGSSLAESPVDVGADVLDQSASDLERTLRLLLRERGISKLKAIDEALERIEDGTFGFCEDCGHRIPAGRLEVMPFATTCTDCKSLQEKRSKLFFSSDHDPMFTYD